MGLGERLCSSVGVTAHELSVGFSGTHLEPGARGCSRSSTLQHRRLPTPAPQISHPNTPVLSTRAGPIPQPSSCSRGTCVGWRGPRCPIGRSQTQRGAQSPGNWPRTTRVHPRELLQTANISPSVTRAEQRAGMSTASASRHRRGTRLSPAARPPSIRRFMRPPRLTMEVSPGQCHRPSSQALGSPSSLPLGGLSPAQPSPGVPKCARCPAPRGRDKHRAEPG